MNGIVHQQENGKSVFKIDFSNKFQDYIFCLHISSYIDISYLCCELQIVCSLIMMRCFRVAVQMKEHTFRSNAKSLTNCQKQFLVESLLATNLVLSGFWRQMFTFQIICQDFKLMLVAEDEDEALPYVMLS